ncbi:C-glycoside deglycosidase beta subunit domain-containing protein [Novosphingobium mathurense]|nr:DUF6379 domain-containing protein [Novosphingobium mathurense]
MLLTAGFENIIDNAGDATGFKLRIRAPYFRGVWLTVISRIELTVNGETFERDHLSIAYQGNTLSMDEVASAESVHWDFGDALTLQVNKPGGLVPGIQMVSLELTLLPSHTPIIARSERMITLVR